MKRDMNLIRSILLEIEKHDSPTEPMRVKINGVRDEVITEHLHLLKEAGLIEGVSADRSMPLPVLPRRITWRGHEFLESIRDEGTWAKVQEVATERGIGLTIDGIVAIARNLLSIAMGGAG